jgi:DNA-binding PadR family transcriptional regulator
MDISARMMERVMLQNLRIRILISLDKRYPYQLEDAVLRLLKPEPISLAKIRRELHYLSEKGFVSLKEKKSGPIHAKITAKGRDLVMGESEEIGIASAESYYADS